jgi:hypothetical protein
MNPTESQALQFAIMLTSGLPASEAILYFLDSDDPAEVGLVLSKWQRSKAVKKAMLSLMKKPWHEMGLEERMHYALDLHYSSLAHFLFSHNYAEVGATDKAKADTARQAIEAKLAGLAGKTDALSRFFEDIRDGKLKLSPVIPDALRTH